MSRGQSSFRHRLPTPPPASPNGSPPPPRPPARPPARARDPPPTNLPRPHRPAREAPGSLSHPLKNYLPASVERMADRFQRPPAGRPVESRESSRARQPVHLRCAGRNSISALTPHTPAPPPARRAPNLVG